MNYKPFGQQMHHIYALKSICCRLLSLSSLISSPPSYSCGSRFVYPPSSFAIHHRLRFSYMCPFSVAIFWNYSSSISNNELVEIDERCNTCFVFKILLLFLKRKQGAISYAGSRFFVGITNFANFHPIFASVFAFFDKLGKLGPL